MLDDARLRYCLDDIADEDQDIHRELKRVGYPPPRQRPPGFATLANIIVAQQVSTKAAATVWQRVEAQLGGHVDASSVIKAGETALRSCGLSGRKADYLQALARDVAGGRLVIESLAGLDTESAVRELIHVKGIGRWSAEIYLLFALGREDVFPANDLALQLAFRQLKGLKQKPDEGSLRTEVLPWAPFRGAGAVFLWHLYGSATLSG